MLNQVMSLTTNKNKQKTNKKASTEHVKSGNVTHNKQKNKIQTKRPQQNMLNQMMSHTTKKEKKTKTKTKMPQQNMLTQLMSHTTNKKKQKTNKKSSTEHVKSADVTHNKQTKQKNNQKGLNRTC